MAALDSLTLFRGSDPMPAPAPKLSLVSRCHRPATSLRKRCRGTPGFETHIFKNRLVGPRLELIGGAPTACKPTSSRLSFREQDALNQSGLACGGNRTARFRWRLPAAGRLEWWTGRSANR